MNNKKEVMEIVSDAVSETNELLPENESIANSPDTVLFGRTGKLDSLGLVSFIVTTERLIEEKFGRSITLANEKALSQRRSPFSTIGTFTDYIYLRLQEEKIV